MSKTEVDTLGPYVAFARLGWDKTIAELKARIPEGKIEKGGIRSTNCTPGSVLLGYNGDPYVDGEDGFAGCSIHFENYYSGTRQADPPGLVSHELRLNISIGEGHQVLSIPITDPWQLVNAARVFLAVAEDTEDWPHEGYEAAPLVLP